MCSFNLRPPALNAARCMAVPALCALPGTHKKTSSIVSQEQTSGFIYNKVPYFAPSEMEEFTHTHIYIYIYVKNILGCKLSMHFTNNQKKSRQVRFTCIYIYTFSSTLPPKLRMLHSKLFSVTPILTRVWKLGAPSKF